MKKWQCEEITLPSGYTIYERVLMRQNGAVCSTFIIVGLVVSVVFSFLLFKQGVLEPSLKFILYALNGMVAAVALTVVLCRGTKIIRPNQAAVFTLFGKYYITITQPGFYFINPFATEEGITKKYGAFKLGGIVGSYLDGFGNNTHRITLSPMMCTVRLDNIMNTEKGYVLCMNAIIEYRIKNPTRAVFAVNNFDEYLYENCETVLRENIRKTLTYGQIERNELDESVTHIIKGMEIIFKNDVQAALYPIGCEVLSVALKEVYDKKENHYYTVIGG